MCARVDSTVATISDATAFAAARALAANSTSGAIWIGLTNAAAYGGNYTAGAAGWVWMDGLDSTFVATSPLSSIWAPLNPVMTPSFACAVITSAGFQNIPCGGVGGFFNVMCAVPAQSTVCPLGYHHADGKCYMLWAGGAVSFSNATHARSVCQTAPTGDVAAFTSAAQLSVVRAILLLSPATGTLIGLTDAAPTAPCTAGTSPDTCWSWMSGDSPTFVHTFANVLWAPDAPTNSAVGAHCVVFSFLGMRNVPCVGYAPAPVLCEAPADGAPNSNLAPAINKSLVAGLSSAFGLAILAAIAVGVFLSVVPAKKRKAMCRPVKFRRGPLQRHKGWENVYGGASGAATTAALASPTSAHAQPTTAEAPSSSPRPVQATRSDRRFTPAPRSSRAIISTNPLASMHGEDLSVRYVRTVVYPGASDELSAAAALGRPVRFVDNGNGSTHGVLPGPPPMPPPPLYVLDPPGTVITGTPAGSTGTGRRVSLQPVPPPTRGGDGRVSYAAVSARGVN